MSYSFGSTLLMALIAILAEGAVMLPAAYMNRRHGRKSGSIMGIYAVLAIFTLLCVVVILPMFSLTMTSVFN
jgi:hypothetical protein